MDVIFKVVIPSSERMEEAMRILAEVAGKLRQLDRPSFAIMHPGFSDVNGLIFRCTHDVLVINKGQAVGQSFASSLGHCRDCGTSIKSLCDIPEFSERPKNWFRLTASELFDNKLTQPPQRKNPFVNANSESWRRHKKRFGKLI
jgi:hypothetical protein